MPNQPPYIAGSVPAFRPIGDIIGARSVDSKCKSVYGPRSMVDPWPDDAQRQWDRERTRRGNGRGTPAERDLADFRAIVPPDVWDRWARRASVEAQSDT